MLTVPAMLTMICAQVLLLVQLVTAAREVDRVERSAACTG